jgi:hypothetical protein
LMTIANAIGLIGFSKCWYNLIFGAKKEIFHVFPLDMTFKENFIMLYCFFFLFIFCFFSYVFF